MANADDLFIEDGYTLTKTFEARPGLHRGVVVQFRPALGGKRNEYAIRSQGDPAKRTEWENHLLVDAIVTLDDAKLAGSAQAGRLKPSLRQDMIDLVLGYIPADTLAGEHRDAKN